MRSAQLLRRGITVQISCYGHQARLNSTYLIDGIYLLLGQYDPDFDDLCRSVLQPGSVVLDVGCHAGITMFSALQATADQARIYGFEPDPTHFQRCQANLQLNPQLADRVSVAPLALSDRDGQLRFGDTGPERGTFLVSERGSITVQARSLDSWVAENELEKVDLLKTDAEGHETEVLAGARQTIERFRPVIFFESIFLQSTPAAADELLTWFKQLGYVVVGSAYPYAYVTDHRGPFPMDLIACPSERWPGTHQRLMVRGQLRRRSRSRFRALVDSWRFPEN